MMKYLATLLLLFFCFSYSTHAQDQYTLRYLDSTKGKIQIEIEPAQVMVSPVTFIMPRNIPGNYCVVEYDRYVINPVAVSSSGKEIPFAKSTAFAPRLSTKDTGTTMKTIRYEVNVRKMEKYEFKSSDASILRSGYAGFLNYSIFGWIEGRQKEPLVCRVQTFSDWPIFSTIAPKEKASKGTYHFPCSNYYQLADGQTIMVPRQHCSNNVGYILFGKSLGAL